MKFLHLSDLHIGKRIHGYSMLEDQRWILQQILEIVERYQPDGVLIAGDIYDKNVPIESGVTLFNQFLNSLHEMKKQVFFISGNHDSAQRIQFGDQIFAEQEIHVAGTFEGEIRKIKTEDQYGELFVYLMPFLKPSMVKPWYGDVKSHQEAVWRALESVRFEEGKRNILVAHQFVTKGEWSPQTCDSEQLSIGGLDRVDASLFDKFDYVALGHLHGAQKVGKETVRYSGSPLKYSFSESRQKKSAVFFEIREKGEIEIELIPLTPLRDLRVLKGSLNEILNPDHYKRGNQEDYVRVILTDERELYAPLDEIRKIYPNILRLEFENTRTKMEAETDHLEEIEKKDAFALFAEFFEKQNDREMDEEQSKWVRTILEGGEI